MFSMKKIQLFNRIGILLTFMNFGKKKYFFPPFFVAKMQRKKFEMMKAVMQNSQHHVVFRIF